MNDNDNNIEYGINFRYFYTRYGANEYIGRIPTDYWDYSRLFSPRQGRPLTNDEILEIHRREYNEQKRIYAMGEVTKQITNKVRQELGFDSCQWINTIEITDLKLDKWITLTPELERLTRDERCISNGGRHCYSCESIPGIKGHRGDYGRAIWNNFYADPISKIAEFRDKLFTFIEEEVQARQRRKIVREKIRSSGITLQEALTADFAFLDLFEPEPRGTCLCDHPGLSIFWHLDNCLKNETQAEHFKNEILRIIEIVMQNRRNAALMTINHHWANQAGSPTGLINGKTQIEVLGANWEDNLLNKDTQIDINAERDNLITLIDAEKLTEQTSQSQATASLIIQTNFRRYQAQKEAAKLRYQRAALAEVNDYWTSQAGSSATGRINQHTKIEVLSATWENDIRAKFTETTINQERDRLKGLIDTEKANELAQQQNNSSSNYTYPNYSNNNYSTSANTSSYTSYSSEDAFTDDYRNSYSSSSDNYVSSASSTAEFPSRASSPGGSPSPSSTSSTSDLPDNSPAPSSLTSSSTGGGSESSYTGGFGGFTSSGGGGGSNSSVTASEKPKPNPSASQPAPEQTNNQSTSSSKELPLPKKQQIIQKIEEQLAKLPNSNLHEFANWRQEIESIQSLAALTAYQNNLLANLAEQKEQQLAQSKVADSARQEKNLIPWIGLGIITLGGVVFLLLYFRKVKKLEKK